MMGLLESLANAFINTFGITQPTERTRRRAAWFIFALLCGVVALVTAFGFVLYHALRR